MNQLPYGLQKVAHEATKTGDARNIWQAHLTLVTDRDVLDEIAVERDLEVIVQTGLIPLFGVETNLGSVNFRWVITDDDRTTYGDITCVVTVGYRGYVQLMHNEEREFRLLRLDKEGYLTETVGLHKERADA